MLSRLALALGIASVAACATAGPGQDQPTDAPPPQGSDSAPPIDAPPPPPQIDASCAPIEMELLNNGNFDTSPPGTGWTEVPIVAGDQLVTAGSDAGLTADTAPDVAWMGGYERSGGNTDALYQDVTIPAGATTLVLAGNYRVASLELGGSFDVATVQLASTSNTSLESALDIDNSDVTDAWTPFSKTFSTTHAGETVRVRLTTTGDESYRTAFFFDSLSLAATITPQGCP